ncbi:MAG TPA: hypothetical protein VF952_04460 [Chloroflexia bacterium]|jgi:hypothetical protein
MQPAGVTPSHRSRTSLVVGITVLSAVSCIVLAFIAAPALSQMFPWISFPFTGRLPLGPSTAKSSGPSAPLGVIIDTAQQEAYKIDSDAVLSLVTAAPGGFTEGVPYTGPVTGSLEVSFSFYRPTGHNITIWVEDAAPTSTVRTYIDTVTDGSSGKRNYQLAMDTQEDNETLWASFKFTPRDAVTLTWEDARNHAVKQGLPPEQVLPLISTGRSESGTPVWSVDYWYQQGKSSISLGELFDIGDPVASYVVDGETGEILSVEYGDIMTGPTPAP